MKEGLGKLLGFGRKAVENYIPDVLDNLPTTKAPNKAVESLESPAQSEALVGRLFPPEFRNLIMQNVSALPMGESRARVVVGKKEDGTRHPHDFVVERDEEGAFLYFIDPEHQMGKSKREPGGLPFRKSDLRPKMGNLIALRIESDGTMPGISILRFRTDSIEDQHVLKMSKQLDEAKLLLDRTSELPGFLRGKEHEITFRLEIRPATMSVESRYATPEQLGLFLQGEAVTSGLKGKINSYALIMRHFAKHMEAGKFIPTAPQPEDRIEIPLQKAA